MLQFLLGNSEQTLKLGPLKARARAITPTVEVGTTVSLPTIGVRARALTVELATSTLLQLPTLKARGRVLTPTLEAATVIQLPALKARGRAVTPDLQYGTDIELPTLAARGRAISPNLRYDINLGVLKARGRLLTPLIETGTSLLLPALRARGKALTVRLSYGTEIGLPTITARGRALSIPVPMVAANPTTPLMGGLVIDAAEWISQTSLLVRFTSNYGSLFHYQLYAGRCLIGVTGATTQRTVVGRLQPSLWPPPLTLLAVDPGKRLFDYGGTLPLRPYNRVTLKFSTSSWPADAKRIDVIGGTVPGGAVDSSHLISTQPFDTDRQYSVTTKSLPGSGTWNFEVFGRDQRPAAGNAGPSLALSQSVLAHPPDLTLNSDGTRFTVSVSAGTATINFTYPV